jgi:lipopolysaccharide transport system permease protein
MNEESAGRTGLHVVPRSRENRSDQRPGYATNVAGEVETAVERSSDSNRYGDRLLGACRDAVRSVELLRSLTEADLQYRYGRGPLRFVRWLLEPFALVGVFLIFMTYVIRRPGEAPGLSIAATIIPFQFVIATVANAMTALDVRRPILLNMSFRRTLIPVSSALTESMSFGASFLIIVAMMAIYGVAPTFTLLWLPLAIAVTVYVAVAAAYAACLLAVWLHELKPFLLSFVRMLFFLSPALVPLALTSGSVRQLLELNPFSGIFETYRDVFLYGENPQAWQFVYPIGIASLVLAIFVPLFRAEQKQFAKVL